MIQSALRFAQNITNNPVNQPPTASGGGPGTDLNLPEVPAGLDQIKIILGVAFGIIGFMALVYVIIGGLNFIYSSGEPQKAAQARQTIIYALIGLAVSLSAEIIVWTLLDRL